MTLTICLHGVWETLIHVSAVPPPPERSVQKSHAHTLIRHSDLGDILGLNS